MTIQRNGLPAFVRQRAIVEWWLKRRHEPFLFGLLPGEERNFFEALGFELEKMEGRQELVELYLKPCNLVDESVADGERVFVLRPK